MTDAPDLERAQRQVAALTSPRNVAIVGASDRPASWAMRVWQSLGRHGFDGAVYPVNPGRSEIWGGRCYADLKSLPEPPDHLAILVPAPGVAAALREGAAAGARSATVFSSGFGEASDPAGLERRRELAAAIAETGLAVSGPNCMGNICGRSKLVTLTDTRSMRVGPGPVAMAGQSGGVMLFTHSVLEERGLGAGYLITSGNEVGLSVADYIAFFAAEPEVKIILCYIEAVADVAKFKAACRLAQQAGKPVIVHKLGQSAAGQAAALAHTGSLAGSAEAFDAVTAELGVIRVATLDDAVELIELLLHTKTPKGRRLGAITLSGAYRGLLLDAAGQTGLAFPPLAPETEAKLNVLLSVGSLVSNPLDGGFGVLSSEATYLACVEALDRDPNIDMLLLQEELPRAPGGERTEAYLRGVEHYVTSRAEKPIAFVSVLSHSHSDYSRALRAGLPHVSFLHESTKALRAIDLAVRRVERSAPAAAAVPRHAVDRVAIERLMAQARVDAPVALGEAQSKELLRLYGIATPREALVTSPSEAAREAAAIGYPVVLKIVASSIAHKSDIGGVELGLRGEAELLAGYDRILGNLRARGLGAGDGMLVCQQISGGVELALGLHCDPEMGLVVMAGGGGLLLELMKDVAFASPPLDRDKARVLLARTRVSRLLDGYRGAPRCDIDAAVDALVALGRIALDLEGKIESIDINPFVALPERQGGMALDALVVLGPRVRRASSAPPP
ncbi:MAG TPA: acetate--CoA ligase family protein [Stellaceae bacterium]|nr:acetate--CoA ligase family protein [Stellaceae bacterium]